MSCILRVVGKELNVKELLEIDSNPDTYWVKGESRSLGDPNGSKHLRSGAHYCLSEADFNEFELQKEDVIKYLVKNEDKMKAIQQLNGLDDVYLDFGIEQIDFAVQSDYLPPELIQLAGKLGLGIRMSQFPPCDDEDD